MDFVQVFWWRKLGQVCLTPVGYYIDERNFSTKQKAIEYIKDTFGEYSTIKAVVKGEKGDNSK